MIKSKTYPRTLARALVHTDGNSKANNFIERSFRQDIYIFLLISRLLFAIIKIV